MTRQRTDEQRKQQIRAAATRCFVRRGYAATRLLDIAREAGLSKGGVYFHYRAKEQLFHDILDAQLAAFEQRWSFEPVADTPADVTMANLVRAHVRTVEDDPAETRLTNLLVTMAVQDSEFRDKLDKAWEVSRRLYTGVIARGIADGVFKEADPRAMAQNILALVQGYCAQSALSNEGRLGVPVHEVVRGALRMLGAEYVEAAAPEAAAPEAVVSEAAVPEAAPEGAAPEAVVSEAAAPEAAVEAAAPAAVVLEAAAPEAVVSEAAAVEAAAPEAAAVEAAAPEAVVESAPEAVVSEAAVPEAAAPEAVVSEAAAVEAAPETVVEAAPEAVVEAAPEAAVEAAPEEAAKQSAD